MADDLKLQLGIDVEALQRSASQATNILSQAFEKGIGASLLGNGMPATAAASSTSAQGSKDTIRGVIDALMRVNQTLVIGFNSIAGGVYTGGGGASMGGGGSGSGGAGPAGGLAPPTPGTGVAGGGFGIGSQVLSRAGDLASALMPGSMRYFMGGKYSTDAVGLLRDVVSQIPLAGKLLGTMITPFHQVMQQNDEFKNIQAETFRDSGEGAMNSFTNLWDDDDYRENYIKRYGFSRGESAQLVGAGARRGLGQGRGMETILNMQGQLGLGQEGAETMGALRRGGMKPGQEGEAMATAIGTAVATGLERGRWGEMLTMWQRAAASSVDTDTAWKEVASQQQFVGSLGGRFKGDTAASQSMIQALQGAASNQQSPFAIRAAMQLTGGDYFGATARMSRAAEQPDTQMQESIINQMMDTPGVRAWLMMPDGPDADRALDRVAGVAATYGTGLSQLKIATLLKAKKAAGGGALFKPTDADAVGIGRQQVTGQAPLPTTALGPRRSQSEAQRPSNLSSIQEVGRLGPGPQEQLKGIRDDKALQGLTPPTAFGGSGSSTQSGGFVPMQDFSPSSSSSQSSSGPGPSSSYKKFVMQGFGNVIPGRAPHPGVDLAFPPGTSVTCPVDGVITAIKRNGTGLEDGAGIQIRGDDGTITYIGHIDPKTFPSGLRTGQRISRGTPLGRTFSFEFWKSPTGPVRTHLHVGQTGSGGGGLDPMRPGGIEPGSLTGGTSPSPGSSGSAGGLPQQVSVDNHVYIHHDQTGRPVARVRSPTPSMTGPSGQLVGGHR